jgi:predicted nucleic acid-binding protein
MMRVYADTSVFGGYFDSEFEESSNRLLKEFISGLKTAVISDLTLKEVEKVPSAVRKVFEEIPREHKEYVILNEEAMNLAQYYIKDGAATENHLVDAQHLAIATVHKVDVLVSWNFNQIVNLKRIRQYNSVNLKNGYFLLEIRSPQEIL